MKTVVIISGKLLAVAIIVTLIACNEKDEVPGFMEKPTTFCNPMNLDYAFVPSAHVYPGNNESHRSTADPAIVNLRDTLYLFSTNQNGYWWSADMRSWNFVKHDFKANSSGDNVCAPGAWAWGDTLLFIPSFYLPDRMPVYLSTDPAKGIWTTPIDSLPISAWDPSFFKDDDGRLYLYHGSSNTYPLYGTELDAKTFKPIGEHLELSRLHPDDHGWERFGENNSDTLTMPYTEGAWMTKHKGKYYFQYAAPGTEWNVYADGVLVGDHPLGPFEYQSYNPFSFKPGGFITGAGHGSTFKDMYGNYWHAGTMLNWIKYKFERRIGIFPAGFDDDGELYCITAYGDYPLNIPTGPRDHTESTFTGWTLLSYKKKCWASSELPGKDVSKAFDENIRDYWSASSDDQGEFVAVDLGAESDVYAIQINYADEGVTLRDKQSDIYHQYIIYYSHDGKDWNILVDKSKNKTDVPHDYVQLNAPFKTRYLKMENVHMADGKFAIAGFRVFGKAYGDVPQAVEGFEVKRSADTRNCTFTWSPAENAYAYTIYYGIAPDKLYNSIMVYDTTTYNFRALNKGVKYYAKIEAIAETGISQKSNIVEF